MIRFSHSANSWQRSYVDYQNKSLGWFDISVAAARALFDKGMKLWHEGKIDCTNVKVD